MTSEESVLSSSTWKPPRVDILCVDEELEKVHDELERIRQERADSQKEHQEEVVRPFERRIHVCNNHIETLLRRGKNTHAGHYVKAMESVYEGMNQGRPTQFVLTRQSWLLSASHQIEVLQKHKERIHNQTQHLSDFLGDAISLLHVEKARMQAESIQKHEEARETSRELASVFSRKSMPQRMVIDKLYELLPQQDINSSPPSTSYFDFSRRRDSVGSASSEPTTGRQSRRGSSSGVPGFRRLSMGSAEIKNSMRGFRKKLRSSLVKFMDNKQNDKETTPEEEGEANGQDGQDGQDNKPDQTKNENDIETILSELEKIENVGSHNSDNEEPSDNGDGADKDEVTVENIDLPDGNDKQVNDNATDNDGEKDIVQNNEEGSIQLVAEEKPEGSVHDDTHLNGNEGKEENLVVAHEGTEPTQVKPPVHCEESSEADEKKDDQDEDRQEGNNKEADDGEDGDVMRNDDDTPEAIIESNDTAKEVVTSQDASTNENDDTAANVDDTDKGTEDDTGEENDDVGRNDPSPEAKDVVENQDTSTDENDAEADNHVDETNNNDDVIAQTAPEVAPSSHDDDTNHFESMHREQSISKQQSPINHHHHHHHGQSPVMEFTIDATESASAQTPISLST